MDEDCQRQITTQAIDSTVSAFSAGQESKLIRFGQVETQEITESQHHYNK
jgi:hypothetical protein